MKKALSVFLLFVVLTACLTGCQDSEDQNFYLGESQTHKGITITINSIIERDFYETPSGYRYDADEGKKFVDIELTVENNGKSEFGFSSNDFLLIETENYAKVDAGYYILDDTIMDVDLAPYETSTSIVRFYVSENFLEKKPLILKYTYTDYDVSFLWEEIEFEWFLTERTT